ncbi:NAD-dependent epimerase/dehydratase family protein [Actinomyces viscosus]|uniref:NADH-flavin reductase n=1 Tax=Actinomyces viscosus TaxID=1656 RepID=A0A3S4VKB6_ACTVI|nr:NAD(P)H-binding protein [Actinomyces viscosus]TFH51743.1 NAD-dependent epimerase/dehydratase family protein [Actinomyces viscosus]VEI16579.1 Putative NADH-flavin reductase [Actinomyces viscosus]
MSRIVVLGAGGQIARHAVEMLAERGHELALVVRSASRVASVSAGASVVEADVLDAPALTEAMRGADAVYANLSGPVDEQARVIVSVMDELGIKPLVFVTSLGIYHELPEPFESWNDAMIGQELVRYRAAADVIEASDLDYTILRPAWLTNADELDYETTGRDEQFKGTEVSRRSVAAVVVEALEEPQRFARTNLGVNKPGTDGPKPSFM